MRLIKNKVLGTTVISYINENIKVLGKQSLIII